MRQKKNEMIHLMTGENNAKIIQLFKDNKSP